MEIAETPKKKSRLTLYIVIALFAGILLGYILNKNYLDTDNETLISLDSQIESLNHSIATSKDTTATNAFELKKASITKERSALLISRDKKVEPFSLIADICLRLIKMIVAPLVLTTLVVGVAKLGDINSVGRIGGKTLLWFLGASFMSLLLGMVMVNLFQPGIAMHLPLPEAEATTGITKGVGLSLKEFLYHMFPASVIDAMAKNEILQIVVFAIFFGVATAARVGALSPTPFHGRRD